MDIIIGSARHDERNKYSGGKAGDSLQSSTPDTKGEVSMQKFYIHSKGWNVIRAKDSSIASKIASSMNTACNNSNIGYSQSDRYGIIKYGTNTKTKCNCDCSSLVRQCVKEATGKDPGDFTTANAASKLKSTGFFQSPTAYTANTSLYVGDILCTKTKGHIVIVTEGLLRTSTSNATSSTAKTSQRGRNLIKSFEGLRLKAYKAVATEKYYSIGYGHYGADVKLGMMITESQAESFLTADLATFEKAVVSTGLVLNQNQFDALVSFTYNCGKSNLNKLIANRTLSQIADAMLLYNKSGGKVLNGLKRRRQAERDLFLS